MHFDARKFGKSSRIPIENHAIVEWRQQLDSSLCPLYRAIREKAEHVQQFLDDGRQLMPPFPSQYAKPLAQSIWMQIEIMNCGCEFDKLTNEWIMFIITRGADNNLM